MGRAISALDGIKVHMMSLSATGINLTIIVDGDQLNPALDRLHSAFFGTGKAKGKAKK
jgi:aspartate kinase